MEAISELFLFVLVRIKKICHCFLFSYIFHTFALSHTFSIDDTVKRGGGDDDCSCDNNFLKITTFCVIESTRNLGNSLLDSNSNVKQKYKNVCAIAWAYLSVLRGQFLGPLVGDKIASALSLSSSARALLYLLTLLS